MEGYTQFQFVVDITCGSPLVLPMLLIVRQLILSIPFGPFVPLKMKIFFHSTFINNTSSLSFSELSNSFSSFPYFQWEKLFSLFLSLVLRLSQRAHKNSACVSRFIRSRVVVKDSRTIRRVSVLYPLNVIQRVY